MSLEGAGITRHGYVATLDVAPHCRGQGLGHVLMLALEDEIAREGVRWMALHVFVDNKAALRLYEHLGYVRIRRERDFYGDLFDAWFYRKRIGATNEDVVNPEE